MRFLWETPEEINQALAHRLARIRKRRSFSQLQLSERSNVSYGSIKRFETSGQISLLSLTKLCVALDCVDEIKRLFTQVAYQSIDEVIRESLQSEISGRFRPLKPCPKDNMLLDDNESIHKDDT